MADEGQVISCHTIEQWTHNLDIANEAHNLVVVDFTASWCGPCRTIAPIFADCAKKYPEVLFLKVDVDEMKDIGEAWGVQAMPTFIFLKDGEKVETIMGARKDDLISAVLKHSTSTTTTTTMSLAGIAAPAETSSAL